MDQTASFTLHCVKQVKGRYKKPSSIVSYITSAMGKAELTPPSEELEPELASVYRGPRPGKGVYITIDKRNSVMPYSLQLEGDDSKNLIIAKAYKSGEAEPFHTWEWSL